MNLIRTNAASNIAIRSEALAEFEAARGAVIGERSATGELIDTHELGVPGADVDEPAGGRCRVQSGSRSLFRCRGV